MVSIVTALLALVLLAAPATPTDLATTGSAPGDGLAWIDDDWPRALEKAKARDVPLFVEAWAPW
jgi:hypothetical protein